MTHLTPQNAQPQTHTAQATDHQGNASGTNAHNVPQHQRNNKECHQKQRRPDWIGRGGYTRHKIHLPTLHVNVSKQ